MKAIQMPLWKIIFVRDPPKKTPVMPGLFCDGANHALRDFRDIGRLWAFLALNNFELNSIAFGKGLESRARYRAEMDEHVGASLPGDEAKTFRVVEPLHCPGDACHDRSFSQTGELTVPALRQAMEERPARGPHIAFPTPSRAPDCALVIDVTRGNFCAIVWAK